MGGFYLFQSRSKLQCVCICLIVSIILVVVFKRKNVYYQQLGIDGFQPSYQNAKRFGATSTYNHSKYNLMEDLPGFGKLTQFFVSYDSDECTLGNNRLDQ